LGKGKEERIGRVAEISGALYGNADAGMVRGRRGGRGFIA